MKNILISFVVLGFLFSSIIVLAAGGGGGGSVPSCTEDLWSCTDWSQCASTGTQTRSCSLSFDCGNTSTPKPTESQSCNPPASPPAPTPQPEPVPTLEPAKPSCTQDTFTCSNWSSSCDANGRESRTCRLTTDCSGVQTTPPLSSRACQTLQCANKTTLRERILCRLNLSPAGVARELELQYLPEACKAETGDEQKECINIYKSFQPCWGKEVGEKRFACARAALKLGPSVAEQAKLCQEKTVNEWVKCKHDLLDKVLYMIIFRFYDLETRAEALADRGASLDAIADFETIIETKKQEFYKAENNQERMQIILDVRKAWQDFVNKVKDQIV